MIRLAITVFVGMLLGSGCAEAADCNYVAGKSVCGVPLDAPIARFETVLGVPDGKLTMRDNRRGYFYGAHLLLVFQAEKLKEIHAWESNPNIDFWDYVEGTAKIKAPRLVFGTWNPWGLSRRDMQQHDGEFPVDDADERAESRHAGHDSLTVFYDCYSAKAVCNDDWASRQVTHIRITLPDAGPPSGSQLPSG